MPEPKAEWVKALRALDDKADLRFNYAVNRWEFILSNAAGKPESQFWCRFDGERDPVTGMKPYRDLTDDSFAEAMRNLQRTFVGNPYDGAGTVQREVGRRYFFNKYLQEKKYQQAGEHLADYIWDHRRQIRDGGTGPLVTVTTELS